MAKRKSKSDPDAPAKGELEVPDTPPPTTDSIDRVVCPPDMKLIGAQKKMMDLVSKGTLPDTAATVTGLDDGWRQDAKFSRFINQLHAFNIAMVEQAAFDKSKYGQSVPAGIAFWLKCVAGWRDKYGDDGFAQHIEIVIEKVDGYAAPPEEDADE